MTVLTEPTVYFNIYNHLFYWEVDGVLYYGSKLYKTQLITQFTLADLARASDPNNPGSFFFPITNLEYILS